MPASPDKTDAVKTPRHAVGPTMSRWDFVNPSNIMATVLLLWAFSVYHRPPLPLLYPSYSMFDDFLPWTWWGWAAFVIALALLASPQATGWRVLSHTLAALFFGSEAAAYTASAGILPAGTTAGVLSFACFLMASRSVVYWQSRRRWWRALAERPPRWLRWLARVEEYDRGPRGR